MSAPRVETTAGTVEGTISRGVQRFKGIPYGAPPVADLRFAAPRPAEPWTGMLDANGRPPTAPQPLGGMEAMAGATNLPPQSEAGCLTLNVWTQDSDPSADRPVMVWIHGGGFTGGTGTTAWYDGVNLAKRDVVVVTINYRLGALGFLHLAGLGGERFCGSGNAGILDQALALHWVRDNIAEFGGDAAKVTIFGESAGGMSVGCQLALPASKGLFRTAIPQSGAASNVRDADAAEAVTLAFLDACGLGAGDGKKLLDLPVEAILEAQATISGRSRLEAGLPFCPVVDGDTLPVAPVEAVRDGAAEGVTLLTGWNAEEMRLFTAMDPRMNETTDERVEAMAARLVPGQSAADVIASYRSEIGEGATNRQVSEALLTDSVFRIPAIRLLDAQAPHAAAVYGYEFRYASPTFGAAHAVEIPFMFDNLDSPGASVFAGEPTDEMRALASSMADAWVSLATDGRPGADWPAYDSTTRQTRIFDLTCSVESDPGQATRQLWG